MYIDTNKKEAKTHFRLNIDLIIISKIMAHAKYVNLIISIISSFCI